MPIDTDRIAKLWSFANTALAQMKTLFGGPANIASIDQITRRRRRELLEWLAPLEALVRKLLLVDAVALRHSIPPARSAATHAARHGQQSFAFDSTRPETWRTCFSMPLPFDDRFTVPNDRAPQVRLLGGPIHIPTVRVQTLSAMSARTPPSRCPDPPGRSERRLALRFEALRRVLENPAPHARRLARRLNAVPLTSRVEIERRLACTPAPRCVSEFVIPLRDGSVLACTASDQPCDTS